LATHTRQTALAFVAHGPPAADAGPAAARAATARTSALRFTGPFSPAGAETNAVSDPDDKGRAGVGDEVVPEKSAANDALTREIEALRDVLAHAKDDLARERDEQVATLGDLQRLRDSLRELDVSQRELYIKLGGDSA
jgi:hypothetical protein